MLNYNVELYHWPWYTLYRWLVVLYWAVPMFIHITGRSLYRISKSCSFSACNCITCSCQTPARDSMTSDINAGVGWIVYQQCWNKYIIIVFVSVLWSFGSRVTYSTINIKISLGFWLFFYCNSDAVTLLFDKWLFFTSLRFSPFLQMNFHIVYEYKWLHVCGFVEFFDFQIVVVIGYLLYLICIHLMHLLTIPACNYPSGRTPLSRYSGSRNYWSSKL